jgi:hypothetical protein
MTKQQAIQQAELFINDMYDLGDDEIVILDDQSEETPDSWIFRYDSKRFVETGDPLYMVQVEFPIEVNKANGACQLNMAL